MTPVVERRLGLRPGLATPGERETALRAFQAEVGLPVTGDLTPATEAALAARAIGNPVPLWFGAPEQEEIVAARVGDANAVRRMQSAAGLPMTGVVDEATARLLGD